MRIILTILAYCILINNLVAQRTIELLPDMEELTASTIHYFNLEIVKDDFGQPLTVPVIIVKGAKDGPCLGLTAAIHGNELNGVQVIHKLIELINVDSLKGSIIAIPGINSTGIIDNKRTYIDGVDLNRIFPGSQDGNRAQQFVYQLSNKVITHFDYLVDMHTASFGRVNSLYVRGDTSNKIISAMMRVQDADILLNSGGRPSAGAFSSKTRTMRAQAMMQGIPTITLEYGNPQVYQSEMIRRGLRGIQNLLSILHMTKDSPLPVPKAAVCKKSYWIYTDRGGYLDVTVKLKQIIQEGDTIAVQRDSHGRIVAQYTAPERGIIIGKSTNPVNRSGGRIVHLGILDE